MTNHCFLVSKLRVNQLQLEKVNNQHANQSSPTRTLFLSVRLSISANSGSIDVADKVQDIFSIEIRLDLQLAPTFNPSDNRTSTFSQLLQLDMLPAKGITEAEFWKLFSKCAVCSNFMTTRTVPFHVCPSPRQFCSISYYNQ